MLQQVAQGGFDQLGDLQQLAQGQVSGPTGADIELIKNTIGRTSEIAQNELSTMNAILGAQGREQLTSRGQSGASAEVLGTLMNQLGTSQQVGSSILQAQQQGGKALMNLPFQRAQLQLSANQQLFNRIIGAGGLGLQVPLQERLAQTTTTQSSSGFDINDAARLGQTIGAIGAAPFTGGASLAAMPRGGGGSGLIQTPNQTGGFQTFDPRTFTGPFGGGGLQ